MKNLLFYLILTLIVFSGCAEEGLDGSNSLLDIIPITEGENCSSGGFKIITGLDLNDNNILDDDEIQDTEYICNGDDGSNGYNSLINITEEPVGENCSSGGFKIESGIDLNNNDLLDSDEIQNEEFICNGDDGTNGYNSLINVVEEPVGDNCASGGYKIEFGKDINGNGILDDSEIEDVVFICNGIDHCSCLDYGLSAYYPLNGNVEDVSGNGYDCLTVGADIYTDAIYNQGKLFTLNDNNVNYLKCPDIINGDEYTICFWIKFTDVSKHNSIISFSRESDWTKSDLWIYTSTNRLAVIQDQQDLRTENYGHIAWYPKSEKFLDSEILENDTFYFVALGYKDNVLSIYLNGQLYNEYENVNPVFSDSGNGYIGICPHLDNTYVYQLDGVLDELRFYNRKLDETEVVKLYNY